MNTIFPTLQNMCICKSTPNYVIITSVYYLRAHCTHLYPKMGFYVSPNAILGMWPSVHHLVFAKRKYTFFGKFWFCTQNSPAVLEHSENGHLGSVKIFSDDSHDTDLVVVHKQYKEQV